MTQYSNYFNERDSITSRIDECAQNIYMHISYACYRQNRADQDANLNIINHYDKIVGMSLLLSGEEIGSKDDFDEIMKRFIHAKGAKNMEPFRSLLRNRGVLGSKDDAHIDEMLTCLVPDGVMPFLQVVTKLDKSQQSSSPVQFLMRSLQQVRRGNDTCQMLCELLNNSFSSSDSNMNSIIKFIQLKDYNLISYDDYKHYKNLKSSTGQQNELERLSKIRGSY